MDYYNNDRYQWELAKLSLGEFYQFCTTGEYPLKTANAPPVPCAAKDPSELGKTVDGAGTESRDSTLGADAPGQPLTQ